MSAWVVEREHIDVMLRYGMAKPSERLSWYVEDVAYEGDYDAYRRQLTEARRELNLNTADAVGLMLWTENVASVCARYADDTADDYAEVFEYVYRDPGYTLTPNEALAAIACYEYQSCEHEGWSTSEAKRFCDSLRDRACSELADHSVWGWDAAELAKRDKSYPIFRV